MVTETRTDPLEAALEEGICMLLKAGATNTTGYRTSLAQCVRAFNGAFTDEEIKRVVRRLVSEGRMQVRTRFGRISSQPYIEIELWEPGVASERAAADPDGITALPLEE